MAETGTRVGQDVGDRRGHVAEKLRVAPGSPADLGHRDTGWTGGDEFASLSTAELSSTAKELLARGVHDLRHMQQLLWANGTHAVLVVFQAIDAAGKDSTIKHVMSGVNPQGVTVVSFRKPSAEERDHNFLWRISKALPARGHIGIFNRSHYEDVLVGRVRKLAPAEAIEQRYAQINDFERMLTENGTKILKFMLHISKKEQGERLQDRLDEPKSRWKFNPGDLEDRKLWDEYQKAYEIMLNRCSTAHAPWHVIPADRKWARNAAVAAIVRETLEAMDPQYPKPDWDPKDFKVE
jgi:PPK2 family polyphosphate:nucleotide phosphotransferase